MMRLVRKLVVVLMMMALAAYNTAVAGDAFREKRVAAIKSQVVKQYKEQGRNPDMVDVIDTGESAPDGAIVAVVKLYDKDGQCLVFIHPKEDLVAIIGCEPLPPSEHRTPI